MIVGCKWNCISNAFLNQSLFLCFDCSCIFQQTFCILAGNEWWTHPYNILWVIEIAHVCKSTQTNILIDGSCLPLLSRSNFYLPLFQQYNRVKFFKSRLFVVNWSLWFSIGCFTYNMNNSFPLVLHACLEIVFEFEYRATYFGSLRFKLILAPLGMPKWHWPL